MPRTNRTLEPRVPITFAAPLEIRHALNDARQISDLGVAETVNAALAHYFKANYPSLFAKHRLSAIG